MKVRINIMLALALLTAAASTARSADDWSFITGRYAVSPDDCKFVLRGTPFSKALAKQIDSEVMTREGITSQRETHCRFRSSVASEPGKKWTVKAICEELGTPSPDPETIKISKNPDSTLSAIAEETFGPDALVFKLCPAR